MLEGINMAKRFTDSEKWEDPFFSDLSSDMKLVWIYLLDKCDHAGFYKVNLKLLNFYLNTTIAEQAILDTFNGRIKVLTHEKWFIPKFITFQYGDLDDSSRVHKSILKTLKKEGVSTGCQRSVSISNTTKDQDKDKDKDNIKASPNNNINVTKEERQKLIDTYGPGITKEYVERLIDYAAQFPAKFKRYASHYATIRNWMRRDNVKKLPPKPQAPKEELRYDPKVAELTKATVKAMIGKTQRI